MRFVKLISAVIFIFFSSVITAQNFEGVIKFKHIKYFDTTDYVYYISPNKVKIDELDRDGKVAGTMLVNLTTKKVLAINHSRKLFMEIKSKPSVKNLSKSKVSKTNETKKVLGHTCTKWVVDNPDYKSKAEYWVINDDKYLFFNQLLTTINRKDKIALYFMQIPENMGYFPITGKEKGYDGKLRAQLETKKLTRKIIDNRTFNVPAGYQEFKN